MSASRIAFGEELGADVPLGRPEGTAKSDLGASFEHPDEHDVSDADGTDQQRHRAESEEETVERALRFGTRGERGRGLADLHLVGCLRVGAGGEDRLDRPPSGS